jgi:hypothetical protein
MVRPTAAAVIVPLLVVAVAGCLGSNDVANGPTASDAADQSATPTTCAGPVPTYAFDPNWPPVLPNGWTFATIAGVSVDADDNVWMIHRSGVNTADGGVPSAGNGPPVVQFDPAGHVLQGWGGPGEGYDWPDTEHGIGVDEDGAVWVTGNGGTDHMLLKFTNDGKFLLQIGGRGVSDGSNDEDSVGRAADMAAYDGEMFVADGYGNKRVVVFGQDGTYHRHWGAYGNVPDDDDRDTSKQFGGPVHGIDVAQDGTVIVGDRDQGRVQSFARNGTFLREYKVPAAARDEPTAFDVAFIQPEEEYFAIADAWLVQGNDRLLIMCRWTGEVVGEIYSSGNSAVGGPGAPAAPGTPTIIHAMTGDSKGNLYLGDAYGGGNGGQVHKLVRQR